MKYLQTIATITLEDHTEKSTSFIKTRTRSASVQLPDHTQKKSFRI